MTKNYKIASEGFNSVRIRSYNPVTFETPEGDKARLDDFVLKQTQAANARGGRFFDGKMIGVVVDSMKATEGELSFDAREMSYSQHAELFRGNPQAPMQAIYVNAIPITTDNEIPFGLTQATETGFMGKLGLVAGGVTLGPDGYPSLGTSILGELTEEIGFALDYHMNSGSRIIPGWMNSSSTREGNHHYTVSFVVPLNMSKKEMDEWFNDWKNGMQNLLNTKGKKVEFRSLEFLPNDPSYLGAFISEQDAAGNRARLLGKSLDVVEEWATRYGCSIDSLLESKKSGARIY